MISENIFREELVRKYKLAGRIRLLSFGLLLFFLLLMKSLGGYPYLNPAFFMIVSAAAILNQPYSFIIKRINLQRLQFYEMLMDIIVISCVLYYLGGLEAPVVSILYYVVILWAGVVSTFPAVFFAAFASAVFFSLFVILEHAGKFPLIAPYHRMPFEQMVSLLLGNISFFFAFGYFSAYSSKVIKSLERKRQEDALRHEHKLSVAGYLIRSTAHDILNKLANIKGYIEMLQNKLKDNEAVRDVVTSLKGEDKKASELLLRLASFSRAPDKMVENVDLSRIIEDALHLTWPLLRYSNLVVDMELELGLALITENKKQIQEAFVILLLNYLDASKGKGTLKIKSGLLKNEESLQVIFSAKGISISKAIPSQPRDFSLSPEDARDIIEDSLGTLTIETNVDKGTDAIVKLPLKPRQPKIR